VKNLGSNPKERGGEGRGGEGRGVSSLHAKCMNENTKEGGMGW
jgi:hypothetical protein